MREAPCTTWLLVRMNPSGVKMKPDPLPLLAAFSLPLLAAFSLPLLSPRRPWPLTLMCTTAGLALSSSSLYLFSTTNASTPYSLILVYLAMFGAGVGMFSSPNMSSLMGSVPTHRRGIASALRAVFFQTGSVISINLAILVMTLTVPYRIVSGVISSNISITAAETALFAGGISSAYLWMACINALAIIPSLLRGRRVEKTDALTREDLRDDAV
jgi:MFS family permease